MTEPEKKNIVQLGSIRQKQIFNQINALHYQGTPLLVCMQHKNYKYYTYLKANPEPISDEKVTATWVKDGTFPVTLSMFNLEKIILNTNRSSYEFKPESYRLEQRAIHFTVPEVGKETSFRKLHRFACVEKDILVSLTQNAIVFSGKILNYSANGILVDLYCREGLSFSWLNNNLPATLAIQCDNNPIYTGQVKLSPRENGQYLLIPNLEATPRYVPREYRSRRQQLVPSPDLVFVHPVTGKRLTLKICDLSSLGFSVDEELSRASLIPGLLIKNATISFANNLLLPCMVQVVYFRPNEEDCKTVRVGFTILNIDIQDHLKLISLVQQAQNSCAYISNQINPSDLFDFFFETGFLYPKKYAEIASKREEILISYMSLYRKGVDISRHFVYQKTGQILGHFSTLRVYRKTWMNQHHAALRSQRAGLQVVRAISEYMNDSYQLNPTNIKYIIGYYRADNKFPQQYFGKYVQKISNPKTSSLDCLSYINEARRFIGAPAKLTSGWTLEPATISDLVEFHGYYQNISGGLLPNVLDMVPEELGDQTLTETYKANGLARKRELHVLRYQNTPKALIDVQSTDLGLNLSEITNAITVYLIDPSPEYFDMVRFAIHKFALQQNKMSDPVMFFPNNYLNLCGFHVDKEYTLWSLDISLGSESYMAWMNRYC
ncbi:MAG: hypothetical protein QM483_01985 [Desulfuromusa sp.]